MRPRHGGRDLRLVGDVGDRPVDVESFVAQSGLRIAQLGLVAPHHRHARAVTGQHACRT